MYRNKIARTVFTTRNMHILCSVALSCSSLMLNRQAIAGHWNYDQAPMTEGRAGHSSTLMTAGALKGDIVITGGNIGTQTLDPTHPMAYGKQTASVDLYRADGSVTALPSMYFERLGHTATALDDGSLLVAGGTYIDAASTSEIYDPAQGWSRVQVMNEARDRHTATLLTDGEVLVAGGCNPRSDVATATAELFDPGLRTWETTSSMSKARCSHTATLLSNGKVLVTGGISNSQGQLDSTRFLRSTELYDPRTNTWEPGPDMITGRAWHNATCINADCSKVLVAGGVAQDPSSTNALLEYQTTEIYDVPSNRWSSAALMTNIHGDGMTMARLGDGLIIAMGGRFTRDAGVEIYAPSQNRWQRLASTLPAVQQATATRLPNGNVLFSGGTSDWRYHLPSSQEQALYVHDPLQKP